MPMNKSQERILKRLESKYDKASEPTRTYFTDLREIEALVKEGAIDMDHGLLLSEQAKRHWINAEAARKAKERPKGQKSHGTPIGYYLRPTARKSPVASINEFNQCITTIISGSFSLVVLGIIASVIW